MPVFLLLVDILTIRTPLPLSYPDTIPERRGSHVSITLLMHILADHRGVLDTVQLVSSRPAFDVRF